MKKTFVITEKNQIFVQIPEDNQWGFCLADDDQSWPGGLGIAKKWTAIDPDDPRISERDHENLDWLLDD